MRILLVTQYYWPEDFSAGVYMPELAESLQARGHDVEVLTGFPSYPHGRIFPAYRGRLFQTEERHGVRIVRCWFYPSARTGGALRRGASAATFALSAALSRRAVHRADIVVGFSPPPFMGLAALRYARRWAVPFLLNVKDLFTDAVIASGMAGPGPFVRLLYRIERRLYRAADRVVVPVADFITPLRSAGVHPESLAVIPDWADGDQIQPQPKANRIRAEWGLEGAFVILYSGSMGYSSSLETVLRAAASLGDLPDIHLLLVGDGPRRPALEALAADLRLSRVQFRPLQSRERFPEVLAAADLAMVTLSASGGRVSTQGKLYSLLAAGRPVVAVVPEGNEAARIVEEGACGWSVRPEEPEQLARLFRRLVADRNAVEERGRAARRIFEERYSLRVAVGLFEEAIRESLTKGRPPRGPGPPPVTMPRTEPSAHACDPRAAARR
jgi:colanic acid biosynthesis glycosyl transferase WcaI